jgi:5-methylcytosine-specific restriction protein B
MADELERVPQSPEYMNPILDVLRTNGRELPIEELDRQVFASMNLADKVLAIPHDPARPGTSEPAYRAAWARTDLKKAGLIHNPRRGIWALTDAGRSAGAINPQALERDKRASGGAEAEESSTKAEEEEFEAARVGDVLATQLTSLREQLVLDGTIPSRDEVTRQLRRFREKFGPDVLNGLDGERLLATLHGRGAKDSLVYWLEFKDDDEFPARFGGIGGGSALKFGLYQSAETEQWMTGSSSQQRRLTKDDAIQLARLQRDQLVGGARVLERYSSQPGGTADYSKVQQELIQVAPDLANTSWGHKYFALLFSELLEAFHAETTQKHHLYKLLKTPVSGRYENARIFSGIARQLDITLLELCTILNRRSGSAHDYWRAGTIDGAVDGWPSMRDGGFVSIGWPDIGDLVAFEASSAGREQLRNQVAAKYPSSPTVITKSANQLFSFRTAQERDIVVAMDGRTVRGVGRMTGPYVYAPGEHFPHRRAVEWLLVDEWKLPESAEGLQTTFTRLGKFPRNIVEIESRLLGANSLASAHVVTTKPTVHPQPAQPAPALGGIPARVHAALQRKRQVILYGPPGTGKTYWAERSAQELVARSWFGQSWEQLSTASRELIERTMPIEICSFHPAYGYEDFLEGYRPSVSTAGALAFSLQDGVFKQLCERARNDKAHSYVLIIDEINRGDIPRIFGELLTLLEKDKRGKTVRLPLSGGAFSVPDNVLLVGTMNTADRSIALLDAALRRRFAFIELLPDSTTLTGISVNGLPLGPWLDELNRRVVQHAGRDARSLQIGHSYLLPGGSPVRELGRFAEILRDDIIPLLEEYCYEDFDALERIMGDRIVLKAKRRIDASLLEPERHDDLLQALMSAFAGITATLDAVRADAGTDIPEPDDEET